MGAARRRDYDRRRASAQDRGSTRWQSERRNRGLPLSLCVDELEAGVCLTEHCVAPSPDQPELFRQQQGLLGRRRNRREQEHAARRYSGEQVAIGGEHRADQSGRRLGEFANRSGHHVDQLARSIESCHDQPGPVPGEVDLACGRLQRMVTVRYQSRRLDEAHTPGRCRRQQPLRTVSTKLSGWSEAMSELRRPSTLLSPQSIT